MTGEAECEDETVEAGGEADEGDVVDALRFEAAPGAGDALLCYGGQ